MRHLWRYFRRVSLLLTRGSLLRVLEIFGKVQVGGLFLVCVRRCYI